METIVAIEHDEIPYWEAMTARSRCFRYTTEIEKSAILKAHNLASRPVTALELGCEGGRWSKLLSDLGLNLICTEIDPRLLSICKKRIPTAKCVLVSPDDSQIPCGPESIDLALCIEVPPVMHAEWFINEAFRVLRKEGLIVGVFWNLLSWRGLLHHALTPLRNNHDWFYLLPYPQWRKRLCKSGFSIIHEEGYCWPPFRRTSNSPFVPAAALIERYLGLHRLASFSPLIVFIARKD